MNLVTRKGKFDAGHRVMHERFKCFNLHGHEYHYELTFQYKDTLELGYAIDFKEIKRVGCEWIDQTFDHAFICNPKDEDVVAVCKKLGSNHYLMNLTDLDGFCNPSAENIAKELFFGVAHLLNSNNLWLTKLKLWETVNCFVECNGLSDYEEKVLLTSPLFTQVMDFKTRQGTVEYDERKLTPS